MPAQFVYGLQNGRLLNVRDLDPTTARGRQCGCVCRDCGRSLQAHMGELRAWHFQHDAEDVDCNPQPMTLLHAFVRDQLSLRRELWLPGGEIEVFADVGRVRKRASAVIPDRIFKFSSGKTEVNFGEVQPDVVLTIPEKWDLAVEIRKTHAVDADKQQLLRLHFADALEFDVSDQPATGITAGELDALLLQRHRWKWLLWSESRRVQSRFYSQVAWESHEWKPKPHTDRPPAVYKPMASGRLREAKKRMGWARTKLAYIKAVATGRLERAALLGPLEPEDRVAVMCAATGIDPLSMPIFFIQCCHESFNRHVYAWQLPIFAAFGFGSGEFTSKDVADWVELAMPDCLPYHAGDTSQNGFSRTRASAHSYLMQLESQGLLASDKNRRPESRVFRPCFAGRSEFHAFLHRLTQREAP